MTKGIPVWLAILLLAVVGTSGWSDLGEEQHVSSALGTVPDRPSDSRARSSARWELTFVSDLNLVTGTRVTELGSDAVAASQAKSVSGPIPLEEVARRKPAVSLAASQIAYDTKSSYIYVVRLSKPVFFTFDFKLINGQMKLAPGTATLIKDGRSYR
jgi:hypothetical protein